MAQVKLKSIALLTGGIFTLLFFHFVPVGLGNVTVVGTPNQVPPAKVTEETAAIAKAINQDGLAIRVKQTNVRSTISGSFDSRYSVARAWTGESYTNKFDQLK